MRTSMRRSMFTAGLPRYPRRSGQDLSDSSARRASVSFSGGRASARSWKTSAAMPPMPTKITAPKTGSFFMPTIISKALGMATIFCDGHAEDRGVGPLLLGPLGHLLEGGGAPPRPRPG